MDKNKPAPWLSAHSGAGFSSFFYSSISECRPLRLPLSGIDPDPALQKTCSISLSEHHSSRDLLPLNERRIKGFLSLS